MLRIEAVTVCAGYGDFLSEVAPRNRGLLDRWVIVTPEDDTGTREVCRRLGLETLVTREHLRDGKFSKGRLIERGLQHLGSNAWRLHLDADVVLPHSFHSLLGAAHLDTRKIYGFDRVMVRSWEQWQKLLASGWISHDYHCRVNPPRGFEVGDRWSNGATGYVPIGFAQMWHSDADEWRGARIRPYPISHGSACRTDVQHALQWDRRDRELLGELLVVHLESELAPLGANWSGRTTIPFGPHGAKYLPPELVATLGRGRRRHDHRSDHCGGPS